jgi:hypothetical protein
MVKVYFKMRKHSDAMYHDVAVLSNRPLADLWIVTMLRAYGGWCKFEVTSIEETPNGC